MTYRLESILTKRRIAMTGRKIHKEDFSDAGLVLGGLKGELQEWGLGDATKRDTWIRGVGETSCEEVNAQAWSNDVIQ